MCSRLKVCLSGNLDGVRLDQGPVWEHSVAGWPSPGGQSAAGGELGRSCHWLRACVTRRYCAATAEHLVHGNAGPGPLLSKAAGAGLGLLWLLTCRRARQSPGLR